MWLYILNSPIFPISASYKSLLEDYAAQGTTGALPETNWGDLLGQMPGSEKKTPLPSSPKDKVYVLNFFIYLFLSLFVWHITYLISTETRPPMCNGKLH